MLTRLAIQGLRGIKSGTLEGLSKLSILVGPNNSGKSTCLEAAAMLGFGSDAGAIARLALRRGGPKRDALDHLVTHGEQSARLSGSITGLSSGERRVAVSVENSKLRVVAYDANQQKWNVVAHIGDDLAIVVSAEKSPDGRTPRFFEVTVVDVGTATRQGALEDAATNLEQAGQLSVVIDALRVSSPGLSDLRILKVDDHFTLHAIQRGARPVPAFLFGDGFKRLLELAAATLGARPEVALLEEPESFQHPRYLRELAILLHGATKRDEAQVILSTHSIELIDLILELANADESTTVHRLRLVDGELATTVLNLEQARRARTELLEDLRR